MKIQSLLRKQTFAGGLAALALALNAGAADGLKDAKPEPVSAIGVQELIKNAKQYDGKKIVLEGFVTEVCKRKGCWANIHDNDSDSKAQIRVKQEEGESGYKAFQPEVQGKTVHVTGAVKATKIDADYLDKWEARVKEAQKQANAKEKKSEAADSCAAVFKQIAGYRERVSKSTNGYLTSVSLGVDKWELVEAKVAK
ncbi:MAG: DUF4920 domain-containing protein [Verrucomicrobiota bacterium]